ncbi:MAG TPA: hypothetical protein VNA15_10315 [Candidatus Angelobacter sp.]|nr:hypothetical protein [Candidatus Angelobacter sp.]
MAVFGIHLRHHQFGRQIEAVVFGTVLVTVALTYFQVFSNRIPVDARNSILLSESGYAVVALLVIGLACSLWGSTSLLRRIGLDSSRMSLTIATISVAVRERPYSLVFAFSAATYGIIFALTSGIFVYQPGVIFSSIYGVSVPSMVEVVCCGSFGQMPQLVIYLTQNLAMLVIPVNVIILVTVSWLVGINVAVTTYAIRNGPKIEPTQLLTGFGSFIGLFAACPTCASLFFLTVIGLTGAESLAISLASFQGIYVGMGIIILILAPILASNRGPRQLACALPKDD